MQAAVSEVMKQLSAASRAEMLAAVGVGQSEKSFQAEVVKLACDSGWMVYHDYDSRRSEAGYPDLTMVRAGILIFAELKAQKGRTTQRQDQWLVALERCAQCFVWRPSDWDRIVEVLT